MQNNIDTFTTLITLYKYLVGGSTGQLHSNHWKKTDCRSNRDVIIMLKLLTLVTLCVAVVLLERAAAGGTDYKIEKNPEGYGSKCVKLCVQVRHLVCDIICTGMAGMRCRKLGR